MNTINSFFKNKFGIENNLIYARVSLLVVVIALAIRICVWTISLDHDTFIRPDTSTYLKPGLQLLNQGSFPSFSRTPVYPVFLAIVSKILSPDPAILALMQIALSLLTMGLIYYFCIRLFDYRIAVIALVFMALDMTSAFSANHLLSETLFTFLLSACLVGILHFRRLISITLIGIGFSILVLCRPIAILLFVVVASWLYITQRKCKPRLFAFVLYFCACSMLLPILWIVRNHTHTGTYFLSTISSTNIFEYRAAWNISRDSNRPFYTVQNEFRQRAALEKKNANLNVGELARWKQSEGVKILMDKPFLTLHQGLDGLVKMYLGISNASINELATISKKNDLENADLMIIKRMHNESDRDAPVWIAGIRIWAILYLVFLYFGVSSSVIAIVKRCWSTEQQRSLWLMLIVIAYFTFFSVGAETNSRFRVPVTPALAVLAATGWMMFFSAFRPLMRYGITRRILKEKQTK